MSFQTIILAGYLGRDPELRYTGSGQAVTNFSMATSRKYKKGDGEQVDETTWFRVSVWGKQAESANQYLKKGSMVLVEGRLQPDENGNPRVWTRQDGTPGASFEITALSVKFLPGRSGGGSAPAEEGGAELDAGDEIPF